MKHTARTKRLLAMLLALAMVLPLAAPLAAAEEAPAPEQPTALETYDLDPATLHVQKLGQVDDEPQELIDPEPYALTDLVRVSIELEAPSTLDAGYSTQGIAANDEAVAYRAALQRQQDEMTAQIERTIGSKLDVQWNITLAANIISANVRYGDIFKIESIEGVKKVFIENRYEAPVDETDGGGDSASPNTANTSENMVGATAAWEDGYTGAGSRVAIIDTGIDTSHQSFAAEPFTYSVGQAGATNELMTETQVQNLASQLNSKTGNYVSAKIPYGYNYVDNNTTITHLNDTQGEHGSHVAGIAAANRYIGSAHSDAAATVGAVGMAPDAQLFIMKVFGKGGGAFDSDYMVAIEDAIVLDCDVVNLSLGSSVQGWTYSGDYQEILNNLVNKAHNDGMVVSISAGNSYDFAKMTSAGNLYKDDVYYHTGGSPGTFVNALTVAAAQNTLTKGTPMNFNGVGDVFYYESTGNEEEGTTYTNPALNTIKGSYSYVYIDATGSAADYSTVNSAVSLSGKIVIVNRGELSFVEKGENAKSYNPKAVIIANNGDGTIYMDLTDFTGTFPMVTITLKDANKIKAASASQTVGGLTVYTGTVQVTDVEKEVTIDRSQATITDFSSWGVPGSLIMKPEITAPGGDIYSVNGTHKTSSGTSGGSDQYENMSGTSMAAPHITGLTGVLAEYLREHPIAGRNDELNSNYSTRAILQSLLMSTATPMAPENEYLSILQQGAGLAEVHKAITSPSVIMMTEEGNTLTVRTGAVADGKIKAELGDDPEKTGSYSFGFKVYNLTDNELRYELDTDLFSQKISGEFLARGTSLLPAGGVSYTWTVGNTEPESHDVDKDGDTDNDDAQAILDYLTGVKAEADVDLAAADLDGDETVTSRDAYLLIDWTPGEDAEEGYLLPARGSAEVVVTIELTDAQREALAAYAKGAYLEGFTYLTCSDGTEHSIPILGFYGSWTDPSMFDNMSYIDGLYGAERIPYSGTADTNYLMVNYAGSNVKFSGNPYMVEESFPADRLAINSNSNLVRISYNLIRAAATTGFAVTKLDADHKVTDILSSSVTGNSVDGMYYSNSSGWQNTTTKLYSINKTVGSYGLSAGDKFRVGFYAIPEYNGMVVNESYDASGAGELNVGGFNALLKSNVLGMGALVGYDFTVDNTDPVIGNASLSGNTLSVSATDNENLAYVAVLSLDGETKYAEAAPGTNEFTISFDASDAIANARGYVAVFAGDYAGNEAAIAVRVNDNAYEEKTVYVLTNTLTAGEEYLIVSSNSAGTRYALGHNGTTVSTNTVTVKAGTSETNNAVYIDSADVADTSVWTVATGYTFKNGNYYISRSNRNLSISTSSTSWSWNSTNSQLYNGTYYLRYSNGFSVSTTQNSIYVYKKTVIRTEIDPYGVESVSIAPTSLDLYKGNTADLVAKVLPLTASNRTVTWSSSNASVATVDANGHVEAKTAGSATITATANGDATKTATCAVTVTAVNKTLYGIVWDEEGGVYFSNFNANNLPTWTKNHSDAKNLQLHSAFMQSTSALYAGTLDSNLSTTLYTVNRTSYALTSVGPSYVGIMDAAKGITSSNYGMAYCFGPYVIVGNYSSSTVNLNDGSSFTGVGIPYGLLDASETTGAYIAGIAAKSISNSSASYYLLDENGVIWQTSFSYSMFSGASLSTPTKVLETGISTSFMYQSLYYDNTYLYWTHTTGSDAELIIIDPSTGKVYNAGNFGDGVWPVAGLYVNGSVAPTSAGDEVMDSADEPVEFPENLQPVATREELMTEEVMARFAAEAAKFAAKDEPANVTTGGLNAVRGSALVRSTDESTGSAENGAASVTLTETENVNNGLVTVTYDPAVLTYTGYSSEFAYTSVHAENGTITLAYADKTARTDLAVLNFTYTGMLNTNVTVHTAERNAELAVNEDDTVIKLKDGSKTVSVYVVDELNGSDLSAWAWGTSGNLDASWPGHALSAEGTDKGGHPYYKIELDLVDYDKIIFNRNGQPQTATLDVAAGAGENNYVVYYIYGVSNNDLQCSKGDDLWPAPGVVTAPTCTDGGYTTYTGMFTGETRVQEETPALGHAWGEPTYEWAETDDGWTCTATRVCANDESHVETETVTAAVGATGYTASFTNPAFTTQTREVLSLTGYSLSLNGMIDLNYYVFVPEQMLTADPDMYAVLSYSMSGVAKTETVRFSAAEQKNGARAFPVSMPAKNMNTKVTLTLFDGSGNQLDFLVTGKIVSSIDRSVADYLTQVIEAEDGTYTDAHVELCKTMYDYGHYAQLQQNYQYDTMLANTYHKVNETTDLFDAVTADALGNAYNPTVSNGTNVTYYGASVLMRSGTVIRVYFKVNGTVSEDLPVSATVDGQSVNPEHYGTGKYYYVDLADIHARNLDEGHTFTLSWNGETATVGNYSVYTYVAKVLGNTDSADTLVNVVKAIYRYGQAAKAYFGK